MAEVKISGMTPGAGLSGPELSEIVQGGGTFSTTESARKTFVNAGPLFRSMRIITAAGAITVTGADYLVVINKTVGAASAVALPAGVTGQTFKIKDGKGDAGANNITITPAAGTIDGAGTLVLSSNYAVAELTFNGTNWNRTGS